MTRDDIISLNVVATTMNKEILTENVGLLITGVAEEESAEEVAVSPRASSISSAKATFPKPIRATESSPRATLVLKRILSRDQRKS